MHTQYLYIYIYEYTYIYMHVQCLLYLQHPYGDGSTEWKKCAPFGQMPYLIFDDGTCICQTSAILLYLTSITNLGFKDELLQARTVEICGIVDDILHKLFAGRDVMNEEEKKNRRIDLNNNVLPVLLGKLDTLIQKNGKNGFALGDKFSTADLLIFWLLDFFKDGLLDHIDASIGDSHKTLLGVYTKVAAMPKVQEWMTKHEKKKTEA